MIALLLAGGTGSRMGADIPKQYLTLGDKPILIHTAEALRTCPALAQMLILCPEAWIAHTKELCRQYLPRAEEIPVLAGGTTRNETIMVALRHLEQTCGVEEDTIVLTQDAVRPFVTQRILTAHLQAMTQADCCNTVIPATDTIVESEDGRYIEQVPNRAHLYQCQTPQTFKAKKFQRLYHSLTRQEKETLTDAATVFVRKGEKVALVPGETWNIKVTYPMDVPIAEAILAERERVEDKTK